MIAISADRELSSPILPFLDEKPPVDIADIPLFTASSIGIPHKIRIAIKSSVRAIYNISKASAVDFILGITLSDVGPVVSA